MIRALIADDEPLSRGVVRGLLAGYRDIEVVGESRNGSETLGAIRRLSPDLVFLDVQMPELDGFGVLSSLSGVLVPCIVFVTAYDEFAVRAFEASALDYLVKPFSDERFHHTMTRVRRHVGRHDGGELARTVLALIERAGGRPSPDHPYLQRLLVTSGNRTIAIRVTDVAWVEADDYYARLHCGGATYLVRRSLMALETRLDPARFVRVHRAAIVNIDHVRELMRDARGHVDVVMADGTRVSVSERRRETLMARLGGLTS